MTAHGNSEDFIVPQIHAEMPDLFDVGVGPTKEDFLEYINGKDDIKHSSKSTSDSLPDCVIIEDKQPEVATERQYKDLGDREKLGLALDYPGDWRDNFKLVNDLYKNVIDQADEEVDSSGGFAKTVDRVHVLLQALKNGKEIEVKDGTITLTDRPLSPDRRFQLHRVASIAIDALSDRFTLRRDYAEYLSATGQFKSREPWMKEASNMAKQLRDPVTLNRKSVIDLFEMYREQLSGDVCKFTNLSHRTEALRSAGALRIRLDEDIKPSTQELITR